MLKHMHTKEGNSILILVYEEYTNFLFSQDEANPYTKSSFNISLEISVRL